ncbi:MAG: type II secretion system protein [Chthoniobacterales bacterium]
MRCSGRRASRRKSGRRGASREAGDPPTATFAFTVVELLVVMAIILVLAGLVLATSSYVHNNGARSRAEGEIAAMSAALENYKADNGAYPLNTDTGSLNAKANLDARQTPYQKASLLLYEKLSGDADADRTAETTSYFSFRDNQLSPMTGDVAFIKDPFGNSYGYSTAGQAGGSNGYNPTFDLWSTSNSTNTAQWIKNW